MPGIGIISNPKSRQNRKHPENMRRLAYIVGTKGEAAETRSLDDLYRVAEEFKKAQIDILGINGGDGSLSVTLTAFFKVYADAPFPKLAILRGGTLNTIATGLGISGTPGKILDNLVEKYSTGVPFKMKGVNTLAIDGRHGFIFGNGIISNFLKAYYDTGRPSIGTAAELLGKAIGSAFAGTAFAKSLLEPLRAKITAEGERWAEERFVTVSAAVVPQIGLGFTPWIRCDEDPERFHVLAIHCGLLGIAADLPDIYRGRPMRRDRAISEITSRLVIEPDREMGYIIDGEHYTAKDRLEIDRGPRLEVILE